MDTQKIVQILRDQLEKVVRGQTNSICPTFISNTEVNHAIAMGWAGMSERERLLYNVQETQVRILTKTIVNVITGKHK